MRLLRRRQGRRCANASANGTSLVTGEKDAFITTADLQVFAQATGTSVDRRRPDRRRLHRLRRRRRQLAEQHQAAHRLGVDRDPARRARTRRSRSTPTARSSRSSTSPARTRTANPLTLGGTVSGAGAIVLDDIIYDQARVGPVRGRRVRARCRTSEIWGNAAIFDFQQTWDYVKIINRSQHDIVVNDDRRRRCRRARTRSHQRQERPEQRRLHVPRRPT